MTAAFYGEPEIAYGAKKDDTDPESPPPSGPWDDYQREREYVSSLMDEHSR